MDPLAIVGIMVTDATPITRIEAIRRMFTSSYSSTLKTKFYHFFYLGQPVDGIKAVIGNDVLRSEKIENMNDGKTYDWFQTALTLSKVLQDSRSHGHSIVFKMDSDVSLNLSRLDYEISRLPMSSYTGYLNSNGICGGFPFCPPIGCFSFQGICWTYMSGGFYGLSLSLVEKIVQCTFAAENRIGHEDLTVGRWIKYCQLQDMVNIVSFAPPYLYCHSKSLSDSDIEHSIFHDCWKG